MKRRLNSRKFSLLGNADSETNQVAEPSTGSAACEVDYEGSYPNVEMETVEIFELY